MLPDEKNNKLKILVLDSQNQNTLAIVRHLGQIHEVHVVGSKKNSLSFYSRYVSSKIILPDPKKNPEEFIVELKKVLSQTSYDLLMPVGFKTYQLCAENQLELSKYTSLTVTSGENIRLASDKHATYALAEKLGVPYPRTYSIKHSVDFDRLTANYPLVIKYPYESGKNVVEYANSADEAKRIFDSMMEMLNYSQVTPIVQEYVKGDGYGFFAYYEDGICKRTFMHHRIREYPVTGGASVCAESFFDEELKKIGKKLLDHLKWNGVAMVEFKKDSFDNKYKLMEINPKFWGSLELAICAGVDFPGFLCKKASNIHIVENDSFGNATFQWLLNGELFHLIEHPSSFFRIIRTLAKSKSDFRWSDIKPNLFQFINIFVHYYKKISKK
jgi:predicted ATP-grasp superfamily ATP-dependent carboligase